MIRAALVALCLAPLLFAAHAGAHELRPAYLDMKEVRTDEFAVLWKVPARGDRRLGLYLRLPETCQEKNPPVSTFEDFAYFERWVAVCPGGVKGKEIGVTGLRATLTDALARIEHLGGATQVGRLTPEAPSLVAVGAQTKLEIARTYFVLGVEHILTGLDHLLFVLALMLLIRNPWMLVKTITAFTIAHSITLAGAALGYLSLAQAPVEATIALSILFLATELAKRKPGAWRLSEQYPWLIAFAFGLLHGLGFAGALREIGLPQTDVPLALLTFNLGVEAGQLMFVGVMLLLYRSVCALWAVRLAPARIAIAYLIGTVSAHWLIARLSGY